MPSLYGNISTGANVAPGSGTSLYGGTAPVWNPLYSVVGTTSVTNAEVLLALLNNTGNVNFALTANNQQITANSISSYGNVDVAAFLPTYNGVMSALVYYGDGSHLTGVASSGNITLVGDVTANGTTGSNISTTLANSGVTAGTYGADVAVPVITVDAKGRITSVTTVTPSAGNYGNANVAAYLPTYTGSLINSSTIVDLYANAATQSTAISSLVSGQASQDSAITTLQANAVSQQTTIDSHTTSISNLFGNAIVQESEIITLQGNAVSQQTTIDSHSSSITALQSNAVSQQSAIDSKAALAGATFTGNVTAPYFIGDGSHLTGLPASYGNVQVAAYLPTYTGVLTGLTSVQSFGNVTTGSFFIGDGSQLTGLPSSYGNVQVAAYLPTYTGALTTSNLTVTSTSVKLGFSANAAGLTSVAIGDAALALGNNVISIGTNAGNPSPTNNTIAIGKNAGAGGQATLSIILNATQSTLSAANSGLYIAPVRNDTGNVSQSMYYNTTTKEITYASAPTGYGNVDVATYLPTYTGSLASSSTIVDLYANAATQSTSITSLQSNAASQQTTIDTHTANIATLFANAATQDSAITSLNANAVSQQTTIDGQSANITTLFANAATQDSAITSLNANAVSQQTTINSLTTTKANLSGATFTGNITAPYFIGSAAGLTGLYSNANVSSYMPVYGGEALFSNVNLTSTEIHLGLNTPGLTTHGNSISIGNSAGGVSMGSDSGTSTPGTQGYAVAIGYGASSYTGANAVSIGVAANAAGSSSVAIGSAQTLSRNTVAIGNGSTAGKRTAGLDVVTYAVALSGIATGQSSIAIVGTANADSATAINGVASGNAAVSLGYGSKAYGANSIAIGNLAGNTSTAGNTIVVNATGNNIGPVADGFVVAPVRQDFTNIGQTVYYNATTHEMTYSTTPTPSTYGNVNVAQYLPTYTGNISADNVSVTSTVTAAFLVGNGSNITGIDGGYF